MLVRHAARADAELHQGADVGARAGARAAVVARPAAQLDRLAAGGGEVDDHLGPLGRAEQDVAAAHRLRHQAAVGADLDQRRAVGEVDVVGAEAGDVEQAQAVAPRGHVVVRHVSAVDQHAVADDAVGRRAQAGERVGQLVVPVEAAVGDHQRDVALAARQRQRGVELVVDDEDPGQAVPDVAAGVVEAVVVVPLHRRPLGPAVLDQVPDVAPPAAGLDQHVVARLARREAAGDVAVEGARLRAGEAAGTAVELGAVVAAVQVDGQLADLRRQFMLEDGLGAVARRAADRRPGEACRRRSTCGSAGRAGSAPRPRGSGSRASRRAAHAGSAAARGRAAARAAAPAAPPPG